MATDAVRGPRAAGVADSQIGVIARNDTSAAFGDRNDSGLENDPTGARWEAGTGIGAAAGAVTGTGLGLAVAAGLIPAIGPIIAGGALMAMLASTGAGATAGTIIGGLIGLGIPEDEARTYEGEFRRGRILVTVEDGLRSEEVAEVLRRHGSTVRGQVANAGV
jgi:hypothetical protein